MEPTMTTPRNHGEKDRRQKQQRMTKTHKTDLPQRRSERLADIPEESSKSRRGEKSRTEIKAVGKTMGKNDQSTKKSANAESTEKSGRTIPNNTESTESPTKTARKEAAERVSSPIKNRNEKYYHQTKVQGSGKKSADDRQSHRNQKQRHLLPQG